MKRRRVKYHLVLLGPWKWNNCCFSSKPTTFFLWHMFTLHAMFLDQLTILVRVMAMDYKILAISRLGQAGTTSKKPNNLTSYHWPPVRNMRKSVIPSVQILRKEPFCQVQEDEIFHFTILCGSLVTFGTPETFTLCSWYFWLAQVVLLVSPSSTSG